VTASFDPAQVNKIILAFHPVGLLMCIHLYDGQGQRIYKSEMALFDELTTVEVTLEDNERWLGIEGVLANRDSGQAVYKDVRVVLGHLL
jgi:hypothetical protein